MTTIEHADWADEMFPGEGAAIPDVAERDRADALIAEWNERWRENHPPIARKHPPTGKMDGALTNRAFLRSQLRRWWAKR
jgi:hypothetical protein